MKSIRISHEDVSNKKFNRSETGGYDSSEVDRYLDDIIEQLRFYEDWYQKCVELVSNFEAVKQKTSEYEGTIRKLESELDELYSNGYSNKVLMQRLVKVESNQKFLSSIYSTVTETKQQVDTLTEMSNKIVTLLTTLIQRR